MYPVSGSRAHAPAADAAASASRTRSLPDMSCGSSASRVAACYFDRPLFPENFSATAELDSWTGQSIDDWQTFFVGGTRLVDYLNHAGYNGLMRAELADGSTISPSEQ